jgi:hypothetical protein
LLSACGRVHPRVQEYPVLVRASDDLGGPLANVRLVASGRELGATDAAGERLFTLPGSEGERIAFTAGCPAGYDGPRSIPVLLLKRVQGLQSQSIQPIELNLVCDARDHVSMIAIRTGRAGIPVKLRGQAVALTSTAGTAHVFLREPMGNAFQLTLDTAGQADLRPESPSRLFTIGTRDAFTVWDQPFETSAKPAAKPKHRPKPKLVEAPPPPPPPPPPKHIPERLR